MIWPANICRSAARAPEFFALQDRAGHGPGRHQGVSISRYEAIIGRKQQVKHENPRLPEYPDGLTSRHRRVIDKPFLPGSIIFIVSAGSPSRFSSSQLLTGLLLSIHYTPSEAEAYRSIQRLQQQVPLGQLLRSIHYWAANLMVVMVLLHMLRVFITGSYKNPRELNWVAGPCSCCLPWDSVLPGIFCPGTRRPTGPRSWGPICWLRCR